MITVSCSTPTCFNYQVEIEIPSGYNSSVFCGVCGRESFPLQEVEDVEVPPWLI